MRRREDPRLITGRGRYAADNHPDRLAHMAVVRAGQPRARVVHVDLEAARTMPGVLGVWTAADLDLATNAMPEGMSLPGGLRRRPLLAADSVHYAGDGVAVVAADTEYQARDAVATCLGLQPSQVVALADDVGGSFGAKNSPYPEYILAAALARSLGRPVSWVATRTEDGHTTGQAHGAELDLEIAADADGCLRGVRGRATMDVGAYLGRGSIQAGNYSSHLVSAYRLPALALDVEPRFSTGPPAAHIRGGGRPVGNFGIERMMDRLARRLGIEPAELRRRNLIQPADMPYDTGMPVQVYDGGDYPRLLELATDRIQVPEVRRRQAAGEPIGLGLAMCVESTGIAMAEPSRVRVLPDATALVMVGSTPQGQGHQTFIPQVVADRLGWDPALIEVRLGDSRHVSFSAVTAGSRSALELGNSVALSAASARRALLDKAAELLEADAADLRCGGNVSLAPRGRPTSRPCRSAR